MTNLEPSLFGKGEVHFIQRDIPAKKWPEIEPWQIKFAVRGVREIEESLRKHAEFDRRYPQ